MEAAAQTKLSLRVARKPDTRSVGNVFGEFEQLRGCARADEATLGRGLVLSEEEGVGCRVCGRFLGFALVFAFFVLSFRLLFRAFLCVRGVLVLSVLFRVRLSSFLFFFLCLVLPAPPRAEACAAIRLLLVVSVSVLCRHF